MEIKFWNEWNVYRYKVIVNNSKRPDVVRGGKGYVKDIGIRITNGDLEYSTYLYIIIKWCFHNVAIA